MRHRKRDISTSNQGQAVVRGRPRIRRNDEGAFEMTGATDATLVDLVGGKGIGR